MSKKHFEAIAKLVREADYLTDDQQRILANQLSYVLENSNMLFDPERFIEAATTKDN
jgi:hypothetical protein